MVFDVITNDVILKLIVAAILGGVVGFEREITHRPAGLRTHILVSLGAALFTVMSMMFAEDPARIAAGIVAGIGFIGAGSIIAARGEVHGITTAASLWVVAAIGLAVGLGAYLIAGVTAFSVFVVLLFGRVERDLEKKKKITKLTRIFSS